MKTKTFILLSLLICNLLPAQNVKLDIKPQFTCHNTGKVRDLYTVSKHVLSVTGAELELAYIVQGVLMQPGYSQVVSRLFTLFEHCLLDLLGDLGLHLGRGGAGLGDRDGDEGDVDVGESGDRQAVEALPAQHEQKEEGC